jgi:hypothetical protein
MFLGGRSFTGTLAALRLLFGGYYLQALAVERDLLESTFLLQLFAAKPEAVSDWRAADGKQRFRRFAPRVITEQLRILGIPARYDTYREYCELASHPSGVSRVLTLRQDMNRQAVGPFFERKTARKLLLDITLNVCDSCYNVLGALRIAERYAAEWAIVEACIDEWNRAAPPDSTDQQSAKGRRTTG